MKRLGSVALVACVALLGCESPSRLDRTTKTAPEKGAPSAAPGAAVDRSGTLEERVARLEDTYAKNAEALDFLNKVYSQQKAQQQAQEREEPAPDAVFAVDIKEDVDRGMIEGPKQAMVTIVEAWDFA